VVPLPKETRPQGGPTSWQMSIQWPVTARSEDV
jgi:hypothetical protein